MTDDRCCTRFSSPGALSWDEARTELIGAAVALDVPPQLIEGLTWLMDIGAGGPTDVGNVHTYCNAATNVWTEHWVLKSTFGSWFGDGSRHSRLKRANPQPPAQSWPISGYSGWWHANVTYSYVTIPNSTPQLPVGTMVFDVYNGPATGQLRGRLFRNVSAPTVRDRWILYSTYVKPSGNTVTELHPNDGDPETLFTQARNQAGSGEYVDVTYTVSQLP